MCLSARDRRRGEERRCCPCVSSCSYFRGWTFTCLCVPRMSSCVARSLRESLLCQGVLRLHSRAGVASRADGPGGAAGPNQRLPRPVPETHCHPPPHSSLGRPTSWPAKTPFTGPLTGWTPTLAPPTHPPRVCLTPPQRSLTTAARQAPGLVAGLSVSRPKDYTMPLMSLGQ